MGITDLAAAALCRHPERAETIEQIVRVAILCKWSVKDTELNLLRGLRSAAPSSLSRGGKEASAK